MFRSPMADSNKTCFEPSQQITFLDYVLNLVNITVSPKQKKVDKIIDLVNKLLSKKVYKVRFAVSAIEAARIKEGI